MSLLAIGLGGYGALVLVGLAVALAFCRAAAAGDSLPDLERPSSEGAPQRAVSTRSGVGRVGDAEAAVGARPGAGSRSKRRGRSATARSRSPAGSGAPEAA